MSLLDLYLYTGLDGLLKIIQTGKLKLSLPWGVNDITEAIPAGSTTRQHQAEAYGYICLSTVNNSPAMWGYYADRGKGACLKLRFYTVHMAYQNGTYTLQNPAKWNTLLPGHLAQVIYQQQRPEYTTPQQLLRYKSPDWVHEQEYRYITPLNTTELAEIVTTPYGPQALYLTQHLTPHIIGIILGPHCPLQPIDISSKLRQNSSNGILCPDIEINKAALDPTTYTLILQNGASISTTGNNLVMNVKNNKLNWYPSNNQ